MFQMRYGGEARNPARDLVNLFPRQICPAAVERLATPLWHPLIKKHAEAIQLNPADLNEAARVLAEFLNQVTHHNAESFAAAWVNSGMDKLPPAAAFVLFFQLGLSTLGQYMAQARSASAYGTVAPGVRDYENLAKVG